jgi:hypothetical protein
VKLLKALNPESLVCVAYTGDPSTVDAFRGVFAAADYCYEVPTRNTKDNWYGLDRALMRWWIYQGQSLSLNRILFLDWDVLLFEPATRLLNQLTQGQVLFTHVFPVLDLDSDHWAREFLETNLTCAALSLGDNDNLSRAFLFSWACFASDLVKVVERVTTMNGYCELRLPFAFQSNGVRLSSFSGICYDVCNVLGEGISLDRIRRLQLSQSHILMVHPVYLPITSQALALDIRAYLLETPFLKTIARKLKKIVRNLFINLGFLPRLNP